MKGLLVLLLIVVVLTFGNNEGFAPVNYNLPVNVNKLAEKVVLKEYNIPFRTKNPFGVYAYNQEVGSYSDTFANS